MTKKTAHEIFEYNYPGGEWAIEMCFDNGYGHEVHERWIRFIDDLYESGRITKAQREEWDNDYGGEEYKQFIEECNALFAFLKTTLKDSVDNNWGQNQEEDEPW